MLLFVVSFSLLFFSVFFSVHSFLFIYINSRLIAAGMAFVNKRAFQFKTDITYWMWMFFFFLGQMVKNTPQKIQMNLKAKKWMGKPYKTIWDAQILVEIFLQPSANHTYLSLSIDLCLFFVYLFIFSLLTAILRFCLAHRTKSTLKYWWISMKSSCTDKNKDANTFPICVAL